MSSFDELVTELAEETRKLKRLSSDMSVQEAVVNNLRDKVVDKMKSNKMTSANIDGVKLVLMKRSVPTVQDWDKLYLFIRTNNAFDLLHKRVSSTAFNDRLDAGDEIEGVVKTDVLSLKVTL